MNLAASFIILLLAFDVSPTLAAYGDLRINGGGSSGRLEFQGLNGRWGTVCDDGFNHDEADVACRQLGYRRASSVENTGDSSSSLPIAICYTSCDGDEDRLTECSLTLCSTFTSCSHSEDVEIFCTDLSVAATIGIVVGVLFVIVFFSVLFTVFCCCCIPGCPCYHKGRNFHTQRTILVAQQQQPQIVATSVTQTASTIPKEAPPPYNPNDAYQTPQEPSAPYPTTGPSYNYPPPDNGYTGYPSGAPYPSDAPYPPATAYPPEYAPGYPPPSADETTIPQYPVNY